MKITIDINDDLARQAKEFTKREDTTLRALIERGLRLTLDNANDQSYQLPDRTVDGQGLQSGFRNSSWGEIREAAYEYSGH